MQAKLIYPSPPQEISEPEIMDSENRNYEYVSYLPPPLGAFRCHVLRLSVNPIPHGGGQVVQHVPNHLFHVLQLRAPVISHQTFIFLVAMWLQGSPVLGCRYREA